MAIANVEPSDFDLLQAEERIKQEHRDAIEQQEERMKKQLLEHEHQQRVAVDLQQQFMAETTRGMQTLVLRVSAMESRQCSSLGRGTDASRMAEAYARGECANLSTNSVDSLVEAMVASKSHRAVCYRHSGFPKFEKHREFTSTSKATSPSS